MSSRAIRDRRRVLRYRNLVVERTVQMKNQVFGLLMETGASYDKGRRHQVGYFKDMVWMNSEVSNSVQSLPKFCRDEIENSQKADYHMVSFLERDPLLKERLDLLRTVPGMGPITALTWALEIGDFTRFELIEEAVSHSFRDAEISGPIFAHKA